MMVDIQLPPGASYNRTDQATNQIMEFLNDQSEVANTTMVRGFSFSGKGSSAALAFPTMTDWSECGDSTRCCPCHRSQNRAH